ncbi:MAG TPA: leucine--tRNA ligase [Candidatus Saccharimonadales bacterium]|nr:leucine--tRNA ligase [Candidatus Saccharimonadales bacterium]
MYNHSEIEKKWQSNWKNSDLYLTGEDANKPKYYILDMFPYPSGAGLHVGHPKGYIATDIFARMRRMQGFNVLHPMGFDAFGLPAENYALKNKVNPKIAVAESVARFKNQLEILGFSYDWAREVNTTDPDYYKWTQWAFLKMWEQGLAFESKEPINWCPSCKTGLANEDLEDGKCERCGSEVEQKPIRQWVLKITAYAERLLNDLEKLPDWEEPIKEMQRNWIGRSEGVEAIFQITDTSEVVTVFTTRIDTIYGCTYLVLAPENELVEKLKPAIENWREAEKYIKSLDKISERERTSISKEKTGVRLNGVKAINPFNGEDIEVFIADYVLNSYGTGAVMAVPAHDERDYEFAKKYGLRIKSVVSTDGEIPFEGKAAFTDDGTLFNSEEFTGLKSENARTAMISWLEEHKLGVGKINYRIKDWVFSRQRYWGEPIPLIHCDKCGVVGVPEAELPLRLPDVISYEPTGTGESPLAAISEWVNTACPKCGGAAKRETNTMPQWAGSCWYYLRYIDPKNKQALVDKKLEKYWSPVDFYVGGAEHATRHLIYARFWHKFLFDIGAVSYDEPFTKLKHVGLIMGEDGRKMSKRWGNVINPDDMVKKSGADALRVYEMFMGPFEQACNWNTSGVVGARKFLEKVFGFTEIINYQADSKIISLLHKTIKKVTEDIESFRLNTAVSAMMILANEISDYKIKNTALPFSRADFLKFIQILAPFAPHLSEEIWETLNQKDSIFLSPWPKYETDKIKDKTFNLIVQVNGKLRASLEAPIEISEDEAFVLASTQENVQKWLVDKKIVKKIFVVGKLLNIVVK